MAGIAAVSVSKTFAENGVDASATEFLVNEEIALSTSPTASGYAWALSAPSDSPRAALDDATIAGPKFTPDVPGYYVVSVTVDGATLYVLRIAAASVATVRTNEVLHLLPLADAQVATPSAGAALYFSTDEDAPAYKDTAGAVHAL